MDMEYALNVLKSNGFKLTDKREKMIEVFINEKKYLTAKDVLKKMQDDYPNVSFDTIYRNLSLFVKLQILHMTEWEGEKKFRIRGDTKTHHHHFICMECGKTKDIYNCPMEGLALDEDVEVFDHKFEVYGLCKICKTQPANTVNL